MATTESRTGFRLPWSSDGGQGEDRHAPPPTAVEVGDETPPEATTEPTTEAIAESTAAPETGEASVDAGSDTPAPVGAPEAAPTAGPESVRESTAAQGRSEATPRASTRKPNKFLADLTRAMQAAAEAARDETIGGFQAEAKSFIETIHARSATEAAELRQRADDDVAAIKDWSKTEIARIREETEQRIGDRRGRLEHEVEDHAALIELEIERVQAKIAAFESEMDRFFERLRGEDDPTTFAGLAENLPEPPTFDDEPLTLDAVDRATAPATAAAAPVDELGPDEREAAFAAIEASARAAEESNAEAGSAEISDSPEATGTSASADEFEAPHEDRGRSEAKETEAAAETEAEAAAETEAVAENEAEAVAETETEAVAQPEADAEPIEGPDPDDRADARIAALGLSPDFAAAEVEAALDVATDGELPEIAEIGDDALAARLAGLVPSEAADETASQSSAAVTTRVVVVGLVSVASIAGFKRHLGRLTGVRSVGVSSGPDGEFVFGVSHDEGVDLRDSIPGLPGFQARVTSVQDGTVNVSAHDPESDG